MSRIGWLVSMCIGSIVLHACSKTEPTTPATPPSAPVPEASSPLPAAPTAADPPAESSLALKRGTLTLAPDQATFRPCSDQSMLWVVDQTDGALRKAFSGEPLPLELYVEAHGERTANVPDVDAARAYKGALILEEVLYATPPSEAQGCKEAAPSYIVAARGNEPFWAVEVTTEKMIWRQPDAPTEITIAAPQSQDSEGTVGYKGENSGHSLELFVDAQACRDSMSGAFFAYSARAVLDGKEFKGCARVGE